MKKIKLLSLALGLISVVSGLQATFYAYQRWENPKTGQILDEYYDIHVSPDLSAVHKQRQDFIESTRGLRLIEDALSKQTPAWVSHVYNRASKNLEPKNQPKPTPKATALGPNYSTLHGMHNKCKAKGIPSVNIECRYINSSVPTHHALQQLARYDDGPILNAFYKSLPLLTTQLAATGKPKDFLLGVLTVDAKILHCLHANPDTKHFSLAAGAMHIAAINIMLKKTGWIPKEVIIPHNKKYMINAHASITPASTLEQIYEAITNLWVYHSLYTRITPTLVESGLEQDNVPQPIDIAKIMHGDLASRISVATPSSSRKSAIMSGIACQVGKPGQATREAAPKSTATPLRSRL